MSISVLMPALSPTMTEGKLAKWHVKVGDAVKSGQVICEIETDKATMEVEAVDEGTVAQILVAEGTEGVAVNSPICLLAAEGESVAEAGKAAPEAPAPAARRSEAPPPASSATPSPAPSVAAPQAEPEWSGKTVHVTVREALRDAMAEEMRKDGNIFLMGEEVAQYQGAYKVSQGLLEEFGDKRVIDTPITEHGFAGLGVGAAFGGLRPIVEFMTFNFAMQAMDQIINSAAKTHYMSGGQMTCPIVFRGPNGAASRVGAQHSQCYASWYAHVPGLRVLAPWSAADAKGLFTHALRGSDPVLFLEHRELMGHKTPVPEGLYDIPFGVANVVRRGRHVTVVALARMVQLVSSVCDQLAAEGIDVELIDPRTVSPLDMATILASVERTGRLLVVDEPPASCGFSAEVAARVADEGFDFLDAPIRRLTGAFVPTPYAPSLEAVVVPNADDCLAAIRALVAE